MFRSVFLVLAILIALAGCTAMPTNQFRVVDESDGQPIAGVVAKGSCGDPGSILDELGPRDATSDEAGLVQFADLAQDEVTFEMEGYETCTIVTGWQGYRQRGQLFDLNTCALEEDDIPVVHLQRRAR